MDKKNSMNKKNYTSMHTYPWIIHTSAYTYIQHPYVHTSMDKNCMKKKMAEQAGAAAAAWQIEPGHGAQAEQGRRRGGRGAHWGRR
jgi:hypothetical protein